MADENGVHVHPRALNESAQVGDGTRIWAFAHVMKGAVVGRQCNLGDHSFVESGAVLGDGVTVKNGVAVWEGVVLEDYVFVGPNAVFTNDKRPRSPRNPVAAQRYSGRERWLAGTRVGCGASIGANATLVCGITLGTYCMVAAGAVVTRDVPAFALVAGAPARPVGWVCACGEEILTTKSTKDTKGSKRGAQGSAPFKCVSCGRGYCRDGDGLRWESGEKIFTTKDTKSTKGRGGGLRRESGEKIFTTKDTKSTKGRGGGLRREIGEKIFTTKDTKSTKGRGDGV